MWKVSGRCFEGIKTGQVKFVKLGQVKFGMLSQDRSSQEKSCGDMSSRDR